MPGTLPLVVALLIVLATIVVVGAFGRGPAAPLRGVIDASIAMYVVRRALGRPTDPALDGGADDDPAELDATAISGRIGVPGAAVPTSPKRIVVAGGAAPARAGTPAAIDDGSTRRVVPGPVVAPLATSAGRGRLWRDSAVAFVGLAIVVLVAVSVWPRGEGAVLDATATPRLTDAAIVAVGPTPTPDTTATATEAPNVAATPSDDSTATPTAAATPTGAVAAASPPAAAHAPTATPRRTDRANATPRFTARPTDRPTPRPTLAPTPPPTPGPTPTATAEPTPEPTPEPTTAPTPTPEPKPVAFFTCAVSGFKVTCDGSSSAHADTYHWAYDDGATGTGATDSHTFASGGDRDVTLTVTNGSGSDGDTQTFSVGP